MSDSFYLLGFSNFSGIGPKRLRQLLDYFDSPKKAWVANNEELRTCGLGEKLIQSFLAFRGEFDLKKYLGHLSNKNIDFVTILDEDYPENLKNIPDAPALLYLKGKRELLKNPLKIGVVGTRKITSYGETVTEEFVKNLVDSGFIIVSGLALGVDAKAHKTALENNGLTIAVLGSGVDICIPTENKDIYDEICKKGLIISYFNPGTEATPGTFPARNRIVAGLSLGVLITEGTEDSGSLITADFAREFDRKVFAIPGPITSEYSKGANKLIKNGAIAVTDGEDIIKSLNIVISNVSEKSQKDPHVAMLLRMTEDEQGVFELLSTQPLHFDEIVRKMGRSTSEIGSLLSMMEIKGIIKNKEGEYSNL